MEFRAFATKFIAPAGPIRHLTLANPTPVCLLNHLVRAQQQRLRNRHSDSLGSFQVYR